MRGTTTRARPAKPPRPGRAARIASLARESVGIVGHGPFATALASVLSTRDLSAVVFTDDEVVRTEINKHHRRSCLPGVTLAKKVVATDDPAELAEVCRVVILALPVGLVEDALAELDDHLDERHILAHAIGALAEGDRRVSQLIRARTEVRRVAAVAGPALPGDLVARRASALVVAAEQPDVAEDVKRLLHHPPELRVYKNRDLPGVELCSALSGGLAILLGIADGAGLGGSPRIVLLTRAVAQMATLVGASGGDLRTAFGMAGLGNLLARSSPDAAERSREYQLGLDLAAGVRVPAHDVAGARALMTAARLADLLGVDARIFKTAAQLVAGTIELDDAIELLGTSAADHE